MIKSLAVNAIALLFACVAYGCDFPIAPTIHQLSAGQTQIVQWSFVGCTNSLNNFTINIAKPRFHKGTESKLSPNTPLTVTATNLTTGEVASHLSPFELTFTNSVQGAEVVLTMFFQGYHNANKILSVEVSAAQ